MLASDPKDLSVGCPGLQEAIYRKLLMAGVGSEGFVRWVAQSPHEAICREPSIAGVGSEPWVVGLLLEKVE